MRGQRGSDVEREPFSIRELAGRFDLTRTSRLPDSKGRGRRFSPRPAALLALLGTAGVLTALAAMVRVRAMNSSGWGDWSDLVPGKPRAWTATPRTSSG